MLIPSSRQKQGLSTLALMFSLGTVMCCALPLLLVALGFGSVVAAMTSGAPWLVTLSHYKAWTFAGSAAVLAVAGWSLYRPGRQCPREPALAKACARADRWSQRVWWGSALTWGLAIFCGLPLVAAATRATRSLGR